MKVFENQEMKNYSNMRVGGKAKRLIILENKEDIIEVFNDKENTNIFFLGNGTNTLIDDGYLDISFISLKNFQNITVEEKTDEYDLSITRKYMTFI